jgi:hypothetical protein
MSLICTTNTNCSNCAEANTEDDEDERDERSEDQIAADADATAAVADGDGSEPPLSQHDPNASAAETENYGGADAAADGGDGDDDAEHEPDIEKDKKSDERKGSRGPNWSFADTFALLRYLAEYTKTNERPVFSSNSRAAVPACWSAISLALQGLKPPVNRNAKSCHNRLKGLPALIQVRSAYSLRRATDRLYLWCRLSFSRRTTKCWPLSRKRQLRPS